MESRFGWEVPLLAWIVLPTMFLRGSDFPADSGSIVPLGSGELMLPVNREPGQAVPVWVHLHGAHRVAQTNFFRSGEPGAFFTLSLPGLSSAYTRHFQDERVWPALLNEIQEHLRGHFGAETVPGTLTLSSFSAGFGGVREILRQTEGEGIDRLLLADSLHAGFTGDPERREINPAHLDPFVRFARKAAAGQKLMTVTHSQVATPTYAATGETAAALLEAVGGAAEPDGMIHDGELRRVSRFQLGGLTILGYDGDTGEAHLAHLRHMRHFMGWRPDP